MSAESFGRLQQIDLRQGWSTEGVPPAGVMRSSECSALVLSSMAVSIERVVFSSMGTTAMVSP